MRIGLVCPYSFDRPGGVQNHVLGLAAHLRSEGHEPHILAPGSYPEVPHPAVPERLFTSAGTAVPVPYNGSVARVNFGPRSAARVARWLREGDFDLVHIHEPITPSISVLALWGSRAPVVATFHTATPRSRSMQLARTALAPAIEKIEAGIAVSESARRVVVQHLGRDAMVVPNGFTFAEFQPLRQTRGALGQAQGTLGQAQGTLGQARGTRLISFLGRLDEPRKGLDVLLAALPAIRERHPEVQVAIAGQGSRVLPDDCLSLGAVSNVERSALLAASEVFVAPHVARESFGIVLLEAMAAGAAVVASDLPAFVDLLHQDPDPSNRPLGHLFPAGDPHALAAAVDRALTMPDPAMTQAAWQTSRRYDWDTVGAQILRVYQAVRAGADVAVKADVAGQGVA